MDFAQRTGGQSKCVEKVGREHPRKAGMDEGGIPRCMKRGLYELLRSEGRKESTELSWNREPGTKHHGKPSVFPSAMTGG